MNEVKAAIRKFFLRLRNEAPENFNPIGLSNVRALSTASGVADIVRMVALLPDDATRPRIQEAFVESQASGLRFGVEAAYANGWEEERIVEFVKDKHQFDIAVSDLQIIMESPEKIITSKMDYTNIDHQNSYLEGILRIYAMTDGKNASYQFNPKAYVIALMLIEDAIREILNPVSEMANDYTTLKEFFSNREIDRTTHPQFSKYQLVQIAGGIALGESAPPRLYDSVNDVTVFLCGTDNATFEYLRRLKANHDFDLSFKPSSLYVLEGNLRISRIEEHLETGEYFSNVNLDGSLITKLYDDKYETLWINVYDNSITFEEFQQEFQIHDDCVVTQVLHCEYFRESDQYFVSHLDHEFIFYDLAKYAKRQADVWQKGNARKRIKTFKIDNGRIPILERHNILFDFLEMKFQNRSLIREYFNRL